MAWLRISGGPQDGQTFRLEDAPLTMGRGPTNHIQLEDTRASRRHASLARSGAGHVVVDLGSENGVYVNGERIFGRQALQHGDQVQLGQTRAVYEAGPGVRHAVDHTREPEDEPPPAEAVGETKGVSLAEVHRMMAELAAAPPAPSTPVRSPTGGTIPLAVEPGRPAGAVATPRGGAAAPPSPVALREPVLAALRRRRAQGADAATMTDLVLPGLVRGLAPDRAAVLLKADGSLKPVRTWQRPDIPPGTPLPALLRELVLQVVQTGRPGGTRAPFPAVCAPVFARGALAGALYADQAVRRGGGFEADDLRFLLSLSAELGPALE